jgi:hypothetical protein
MYSLVNKAPTAVMPVVLDWSEWLGSETISSSSWVVEAGLTISATQFTTTTTTAWLTGGVLGETYILTNTVVTSTGRTEPRAVVVKLTSK